MDKAIQLVVEVLAKKLTVKDGITGYNNWKTQIKDQKSRSRSSCIGRLFRSLYDTENELKLGSWYVVATHLRQVILVYNHRFHLHEDYCVPLSNLTNQFKLSIDSTNEVNALATYPSWFEHYNKIKSVFDLERRRNVVPQLGDGLLFHMTGYSYYQSKEQKLLVQTCLAMNDGETLIASLPTGGGKSLIGQLPAYIETRGGTIHGGVTSSGTTIVVVPTVALALDQYYSATKLFPDALSEAHRPQAYVSGMSEGQRKVIIEGLENGTLPLLYTSPEALLNGSLHHIILQAARQERINRLVIDEAHIVVDWGSSFRTDFQLLSVFRKKLLEASDGKLKTVLLSATLTDTASETLRTLFSEDDNLIEIRSDALRFEPIYFIDRPDNQQERQERILEIIPLLPKPMILYVTKKEHAHSWTTLIKGSGFTTVEEFTGDTKKTERERILTAWNDNQVDIIVATSAFGMGVDKGDVRTVIHCCLPESVNRFYQEVGRGGRDGYASISLLSTIKEDIEESGSLKKSDVLKEGNMAERWEKLRTQPLEVISGDTLWVDTNVRPKHLKDDETGRRNANWNETALLFLYRTKLIDILDFRKLESDKQRSLLVQILDITSLQDKETLITNLEPERRKERMRLNDEFLDMLDLVEKSSNTCLSEAFLETYSYASEVCGGCPCCHLQNNIPYQNETVTVIRQMRTGKKHRAVGKVLGQYLGGYQDLFISCLVNENQILEKEAFLKELIQSGIKSIIVPSISVGGVSKLLANLPKESHSSYAFLTVDELLLDGHNYHRIAPLAIIYPTNSLDADKLYCWIQENLKAREFEQVIHIAHKDLFINSERKKLIELIEGNVLSLETITTEVLEEEFI